MEEKLTREKTLSLHKQMWTDMLLILGNNPNRLARTRFKRIWLQAHGYENVESNCFLCEYVFQQREIGKDCCEFCLIDWSPLSAEEDANCGDSYIYNNYKSIWTSAPISEILNLPEKEGV